MSTKAIVGVVLLALSACGSSMPQPKPSVEGDDAVARGSNYLIARGDRLDPAAAFPLVYLERNFGTQWARPHIDRAAAFAREHRGDLFIGGFERVFDPSARLSEDLSARLIEGYESSGFPSVLMSIVALHCDQEPLPEDFAGRAARISEERASSFGWVVIATEWARELGCLESDSQAREEQRLKLVSIAEGSTGFYMFEAIALLYYSGNGSSVSPEWIEKMKRLQAPEGWWHPVAENVSVDVATVWALWGLLEAESTQPVRVGWLGVESAGSNRR